MLEENNRLVNAIYIVDSINQQIILFEYINLIYKLRDSFTRVFE